MVDDNKDEQRIPHPDLSEHVMTHSLDPESIHAISVPNKKVHHGDTKKR